MSTFNINRPPEWGLKKQKQKLSLSYITFLFVYFIILISLIIFTIILDYVKARYRKSLVNAKLGYQSEVT